MKKGSSSRLRQKLGVSGVVRLDFERVCTGREERGEGRKRKEGGNGKRTQRWSSAKHAESGTETVCIPNPVPLFQCFYDSPLYYLPQMTMMRIVQPPQDTKHTSPRDKSVA